MRPVRPLHCQRALALEALRGRLGLEDWIHRASMRSFLGPAKAVGREGSDTRAAAAAVVPGASASPTQGAKSTKRWPELFAALRDAPARVARCRTRDGSRSHRC
eukprot:GHVT01084424.1.p4 GENE.GHVT01084424.1~~GHVT01084424.1.p4  ORF type:complete len:104 (+),score=20.73 GHVT01084424.1:279-590(+)